MKRTTIIIIIIIIIIAAGFFIMRLVDTPGSIDDLNQKMEALVSGMAGEDKPVKNCVLSVIKGDGSFSWSGAAGTTGQIEKPMAPETPFFIASITKLYSAAVIMRLYEKGALSLDDPICKYLPRELIKEIHVYKGRDYTDEITIRHLLSHTSGIADYYEGKTGDGKNIFDIFLENPERQWTVDETIARARDKLKPNFPPGTDSYYSDTNFQLLGKIIEAVTGKPLHIAYEDFIFRPLGLKNTWLSGHRPLSVKVLPADVFYNDINISRIRLNGSYWADGGIVSTAKEMIIFQKSLNEGRIIKKETLRLMHNWHKLFFPLQYGYGTMYFKLPGFINKFAKVPALWGHSGSTGSFLYYSEELDMYLAGTTNLAGSDSRPFRLMISVIKTLQSFE